MLFNSVEELKGYVLGKCAAAVANVEQKVHAVIDQTLAQFYGEFEPSEYIRTYNLVHSLVKTGVKSTGNGVEAEVYFDASALNYASPVQGKSGRYHEALYNGGQVLDMAMHGSHGGYTSGTAIWSVSQARLGDIYALLIKELKAQGIPIK